MHILIFFFLSQLISCLWHFVESKANNQIISFYMQPERLVASDVNSRILSSYMEPQSLPGFPS